jgi:hypothetical protein
MEQSSGEVSASQEITRILWNPNVNRCLHKSLPLALCPEPDQSSPRPQSYFLKINCNITVPSTPWSSKWSLSLGFPHQNPIGPLLSPIRPTRPVHLILLYLITRKIFGKQYRSCNPSLCSSLSSFDIPSLLGPNTHLTPLVIMQSSWAPCYVVALRPLNEARVRVGNLEILLENSHLHIHEMEGR